MTATQKVAGLPKMVKSHSMDWEDTYRDMVLRYESVERIDHIQCSSYSYAPQGLTVLVDSYFARLDNGDPPQLVAQGCTYWEDNANSRESVDSWYVAEWLVLGHLAPWSREKLL